MEEYSRAYAVLVACRAANCIDQIVLLAMVPLPYWLGARQHTTVAEDMLSAAKSVFQVVLPK
jgi:hypothetical protein